MYILKKNGKNYNSSNGGEKIRMKKNDTGITLVALVITIIVMLILAGVAINLTIGENGLIVKTQQAKNEYQKVAVKEELELGIIDVMAKVPQDNELSMNDYIVKELPNHLKQEIVMNEDLTGIYKGYEYWIDDKYVVHIDEKIDKEDLIQYLYKEGDECVSVTGGWDSYYKDVTTINQFNEKVVSISSQAQQYGNYFTDYKIDLTKYNTIYVEATINNSNSASGDFVISNTKETNAIVNEGGGNNNGIVKNYILNADVIYYEIDISDLNGEYYVGFILSNRTITIKNVYMSKNMSKSSYLINRKYEVVPWTVSGQTRKTITERGMIVTTVPNNAYGNYRTTSQIDLKSYRKLCFIGEIDAKNSASGHLIVTQSKETTTVRSRRKYRRTGSIY